MNHFTFFSAILCINTLFAGEPNSPIVRRRSPIRNEPPALSSAIPEQSARSHYQFESLFSCCALVTVCTTTCIDALSVASANSEQWCHERTEGPVLFFMTEIDKKIEQMRVEVENLL